MQPVAKSGSERWELASSMWKTDAPHGLLKDSRRRKLTACCRSATTNCGWAQITDCFEGVVRDFSVLDWGLGSLTNQCYLFFKITIRTSGWVLREVFCESTRVVPPLLRKKASREPVLSTRCLRIAKEICGLGVPPD